MLKLSPRLNRLPYERNHRMGSALDSWMKEVQGFRVQRSRLTKLKSLEVIELGRKQLGHG